MGKIMAVNISEKKGTQKKNVHSARLMEEFGIEKDAHAGKWHRQVSLLSYEKIEEFKAKGAPIEDGAFGENLIVSGYDLKALPVGTRLRSGEVLLEVTQIGKKCHSGCVRKDTDIQNSSSKRQDSCLSGCDGCSETGDCEKRRCTWSSKSGWHYGGKTDISSDSDVSSADDSEVFGRF